MDDKTIIKKIQEGEIDCFSLLVKKYLPSLRLFFLQRVKDKDDQEDLIQETFFNFYRNINRFNQEKEIKPYLLAIASNQLKMFWRKRKISVNLDENIIDEKVDFEKDYLPLDISLARKDQKIIHFLKEGYRYNEIGKMLKLNVNTIKTIIRRLRLKIKNEKSK